ncbi:hypothetical protein ACFL5V_08185 [Fibrobacterota bacterium]
MSNRIYPHKPLNWPGKDIWEYWVKPTYLNLPNAQSPNIPLKKIIYWLERYACLTGEMRLRLDAELTFLRDFLPEQEKLILNKELRLLFEGQILEFREQAKTILNSLPVRLLSEEHSFPEYLQAAARLGISTHVLSLLLERLGMDILKEFPDFSKSIITFAIWQHSPDRIIHLFESLVNETNHVFFVESLLSVLYSVYYTNNYKQRKNRNEALIKAVDLINRLKQIPNFEFTPEILKLLSRLYMESGYMKLALKILEPWHLANKEDAEKYLWYNRALILNQNYDQAVDALQGYKGGKMRREGKPLILMPHIESTGCCLVLDNMIETYSYMSVLWGLQYYQEMDTFPAQILEHICLATDHINLPDMAKFRTGNDLVISVIRNPYDRWRSSYRYKTWACFVPENQWTKMTYPPYCKLRNFENFMASVYEQYPEQANIQCRRICGEPDFKKAKAVIKSQIHLLGMTENINAFYQTFCDITGYEPGENVMRNARTLPGMPEEHNEMAAELINRHCAEDIKLWHWLKDQDGLLVNQC